MTEPFSLSLRARWADMDFNQHMRNSAFLGCAEQCRMEFLDAHGWSMREFMKRQLGPVVLEDTLRYRRELGLLQEFRVDIRLAAATADARRIKIRNRFELPDGQESAVIDSVVLWFDLVARRPVVPPQDLADVWLGLPRTDDFEQW